MTDQTQNLGLIIALAASVFTIVASMIAMMLWVRSEGNADRRDIVNLIIAIKEDMHDFHTQLQLQDKEFKMRLCAIEEKRTKG